MHQSRELYPSLAKATELVVEQRAGNCIPIAASIPADLLTPVAAYLKLTDGAKLDKKGKTSTSSSSLNGVEGVESFLLESVIGAERQSRFSYVGANPFKVIRTGPEEALQGDPLTFLERELSNYKFVKVDGHPPFTGGAIGFLAYDAVYHFEPKAARPLTDPHGVPESVFMLCDTIVAFDHIYQTVKVISHALLPIERATSQDVAKAYQEASLKIEETVAVLLDTLPPQLPEQERISPPNERKEGESNVGKVGYESFVTKLKKNIVAGDIIQAVPSQRIRRETKLHPFNAYRYLRQLNPSPYMFYINCGSSLQLVGASPECLCEVASNVVTNHAIAGTIRRGVTPAEDAQLATVLKESVKDRAEHVMLVDLARNDVNRVCQPESVKVDSLMAVEKFSHVMHLTSQISGKLRDGMTKFDALRSIFPAGTVSGAPKIRAMELIAEYEGERRGAYAGAVGHIDFASDAMDMCIAIRTMTFKNGVAYLQAGGGIVYDSVEEDEYVETINKLKSNVNCLNQAEDYYYSLENGQA